MNIELYPWLYMPWNQLQARRTNLPHALLIHGRPGLGKTVLARLFAQRLLCEGPADGDLPCGECSACLWFEQGSHPDFRLLEPEALSTAEAEPRTTEGDPRKAEAASRQIRIDQVRELQDFLAIGTHRGGLRVVVVRPAEAMNVATANALLKSLEEPPPKTAFVLVSSAPDRLLPTVRSRCQRIGVAPATPAAAVAWLRPRGLQDAEAALAYAANAPLAALEDAEERAVRDSLVAGHLAVGARDALELADACQGVAPARVIFWLQKWVVDLVLARTAGTTRYHQRQAPALRALAGSLALERLLRFERSLAEAAAVAQHPLNPRLFLEDVFLRYGQIWEARIG
jgi:DNA polymerase III subunit delta'